MSLRSTLSKNPFLHYLFDLWAGKALSLSNTIYINFEALPFSKAIKFPIWVYQGVKLEQVGKIVIDAPISKGMIRIGNYMFLRGCKTYWINRGTIFF